MAPKRASVLPPKSPCPAIALSGNRRVRPQIACTRSPAPPAAPKKRGGREEKEKERGRRRKGEERGGGRKREKIRPQGPPLRRQAPARRSHVDASEARRQRLCLCLLTAILFEKAQQGSHTSALRYFKPRSGQYLEGSFRGAKRSRPGETQYYLLVTHLPNLH